MQEILARIVTMTCILVAAPALADTQTRNVEGFSEVVFKLPFDVEFVPADSNYVTLRGDADTIDQITSRVKRDSLIIERRGQWPRWSNATVSVTVGYRELNTIVMAGSGDGFADLVEGDEVWLVVSGSANLEVAVLRAAEANLTISGSGDINVRDVEVDAISTRIAGSGNVEVSGHALSQDISIAGSGDHDAAELATAETRTRISGSGDARVWAEEHLTATLTGSGDIEYFGSPDVSRRVTGSGDIERVSRR